MQKKYCLLILAFAFMLGTIVAALPPVKATPTVRFYVFDAEDAAPPRDNIVDPVSPTPLPIPNVDIHVYIESPYAWMGTADGIVAYMVSVRVDPRFLEVKSIVAPGDHNGDGFSDGILEMFAAFYPPGSTLSAPASADAATGTMYGFANSLVNMPDPTIGAGGDAFYGDDEAMLCTIKARVAMGMPAGSSVIDLMGPGVSTEQIVDGIKVSCKYTTAAGITVEVEPEDGYYTSATPDISFFDLTLPASVIGSYWHELQPEYCREWRIDSHEDTNADGELDASEQIDMTRLIDEYKAWYHVEWVNPTPVAGDGKTDLIVKFKEPYPEFPLGLEIIMMIAAAIPIIYIWRTRKWAGKK